MINKNDNISSPGYLAQDKSVKTFMAPFYAILVMYIIGAIWPKYVTWGFNYWSLFDLRLSLPLLGVAILLMTPYVSTTIWLPLRTLFNKLSQLLSGLNNFLVVAIVSGVLFHLFFLFRSRALVYGDGYQIISLFSPKGDAAIGAQLYFQAFSIHLYKLVLPLLTSLFNISIENALAIINALGGVVGFWALYAISGRLTSQMCRKVFLLCSALTSGSVVLFFGYIETYTLPMVVGLWTLYFAVGYVQNRNSWLPLILCGLLSFSLHLITLPFLIIAFLAIILRKIKNGRLPFNLANWHVGLIVVTIISVLAIAAQSSGIIRVAGLYNVFVLVWPNIDKPYWFLSIAHLVDILNLCLLVAPLGLTLSIFFVLARKYWPTKPDKNEILLGLLALITFMVAFWIDPLLGTLRDWDLLSYFGFPLSIWAAYRFSKLELFKNNASTFITASIMIIFVHLGPNIYEKNRVQIAVEHLDNMVWECPHYQEDYLHAYRGISWGNLLIATKNDGMAVRYFRRRLDAEVKTPSAWSNLAYIYGRQNKLDSASYCLKMAVSLSPENISYWHRLANLEQERGNLNEALAIITQAEQINPNNSYVNGVKGHILLKLNKISEAEKYLHRAYELNPDGIKETKSLGVFYALINNHDSAYVYLNKAVMLNPKDFTLLPSLLLSQLALEKIDEAQNTHSLLIKYDSTTPDLNYFKAILKTHLKTNNGQTHLENENHY